MRLIKSYEDKSKTVFCAIYPDRRITKKEFIVVTDLDSENPLFALRKRLVVDFLKFVTETEGEVSWADLNVEISAILSAEFHTI